MFLKSRGSEEISRPLCGKKLNSRETGRTTQSSEVGGGHQVEAQLHTARDVVGVQDLRQLHLQVVVDSVCQLHAARLLDLGHQANPHLLLLVLELRRVGVVLLQLRLLPHHVQHGVDKLSSCKYSDIKMNS